MVLGYSHALHSIGGDCVGLGGAQAISGGLCSSGTRTSAPLHMPITARSHTPAQPLWYRICARVDTQDAVEHCRGHRCTWPEAPELDEHLMRAGMQVCLAASAYRRARCLARSGRTLVVPVHDQSR